MTQKTKINDPHARFFHDSMNDPRVAKEFFETYLPENILKRIDLNTLELCKENFSKKIFRALIND